MKVVRSEKPVPRKQRAAAEAQRASATSKRAARIKRPPLDNGDRIKPPLSDSRTSWILHDIRMRHGSSSKRR